MVYHKPELAKVANAINSIQSGTEKDLVGSDGGNSFLQSDPAYDADE
jgi:hypothetical protein